MKILLIGGTGIISMAVSEALLKAGHELWLINRGNNQNPLLKNANTITADINDTASVSAKLKNMKFDCIADFIAQTPTDIDRDHALFAHRTKQYIFISSSCIYQKPLSYYEVTESTPLYNPYWDYAQNKIACENRLTELYQVTGFPITILRPGHTYDHKWLPLAISGWKGCYSVIRRMLEGKPTIIPGDGTSLWTVTHNSDFARAFLGIVGNPSAIGEAINISSDEVLTWNQIYQTIADALNVPLKPFYVASMFLHQAGPYDFKCCLIGERAQSIVYRNDKLKRLVPGFQAQVPFREGIRDSLQFLLSHPEYQEEDPIFDSWCDSLVEVLNTAASQIQHAFPNCI